jgi:recombination protein RecA
MARVRGGGSAREDDEKNELAETMATIRKRFGNESLSTASTILQPDRISTGVFILDYYTLGGIPNNRATMYVGERHAGKSMLATLTAGNAQRQYPESTVALIDVEGTFDPVWGAKLGVDTSSLVVASPETGEAAVDVTDALIGTKEVSLVIIDSVAMLTPMKEVESSAEDALVGMQARLVSSMVRKATSSMIRERRRGHLVSLLFVNQFRAKIGGFAGFGEPRSIPGGKALEFSTSLQVIVKNKENHGKDELGNDAVTVNEHSFTITKNKLNGGGRTGEFRLRRTPDPAVGLLEGQVDDASTMLAFAKKYGAYTGGGSSWKLEFFNYDLKFKGLAAAVLYLYENREVYWDLRNYLIASYAESLNMPEEFVQRFLQ